MKINAMLLKVSTGWRRFKTAISGKLPPYDSAEVLTSEEAIETFMAEALKTKDAGFIAYANGVVARARGMRPVTNPTNLPHWGRRLIPSIAAIASVAAVALVAVIVVKVQSPEIVSDGSMANRGDSVAHGAYKTTIPPHNIGDEQRGKTRITGDIQFGISPEQYAAGLKQREREVVERLQQAQAEERRMLEAEWTETKRRLADVEASYKVYIQELKAHIVQLEAMRGQVPDRFLDQARAALVQGDRSEADWLFAQFTASAK